MNSEKQTARLAGLLWLLGAFLIAFSLLYVRSTVIVFADAAATVHNIVVSEPTLSYSYLTGYVDNYMYSNLG